MSRAGVLAGFAEVPGGSLRLFLGCASRRLRGELASAMAVVGDGGGRTDASIDAPEPSSFPACTEVGTDSGATPLESRSVKWGGGTASGLARGRGRSAGASVSVASMPSSAT